MPRNQLERGILKHAFEFAQHQGVRR
jgi:hypothetical protein